MTFEEELLHRRQVMQELEGFDTPTITNVIATFPNDTENCLGLYDPWEVNWYSDHSLKCMYPEHGRRVGYVVTAVYKMPDPSYKRLAFEDILKAADASPKPVILAIMQNFPEKFKKKNGQLGGNMLTAYKQLGVVGVMTDGPSRDIDEIRPLGIQCMFTGLSAGHGDFAVQAVNVPVNICGMDVVPGEIVHMDENGAVKFPAAYLDEILIRAKRVQEIDDRKQAAMRKTNDPAKLAKIMKGIIED